MTEFNGLAMGLHSLPLLSNAVTRSISAENPNGEPSGGAKATDGTGAHASRELGKGWKVSPSINIGAHETVTIAEITGSGAIQHIWNTVHPDFWRRLILRIYWDGEESPSVETPLGDFFCNGWCQRCNVSSIPIAVNPAGGFNSYWLMPFRNSARIIIENLSDEVVNGFYYQITYTLTEIPANCATFHAQIQYPTNRTTHCWMVFMERDTMLERTLPGE